MSTGKNHSMAAPPFNDACYEGRVSVVQFLLTLPTVDVNQPQKEGATPFIMACHEGRTKVVSLLLADSRIDVEKPDISGVTPLKCGMPGRPPRCPVAALG